MSAFKESWSQKLRLGLKKTSQAFGNNIRNIFSHNSDGIAKLSPEVIDEFYDLLIQGDIGPSTASEICESLKTQKFVDKNDAIDLLIKQFTDCLLPYSQPFAISPSSASPQIILMAGVNGSGKTTTIAKLTQQCLDKNLSVEWAACDTFRAAAIEQIEVWSKRLRVPLYQPSDFSHATDPASIAYQAFQHATQKQTDVLFIDTAGRLQNNTPLMRELSKIVRVLKKIDPSAPHQSLLILDGTTGQNTYSQVVHFSEIIPITGLVITKLDGTAKAGFIIELCKKTQLPITAIGVGEGIHDLNQLDCHVFAESLFQI